MEPQARNELNQRIGFGLCQPVPGIQAHAHHGLEGLFHEFVPSAEVVLYQSQAHSGLVGDVLQPCPVSAVLGDQVDRRAQNLSAPEGGVLVGRNLPAAMHAAIITLSHLVLAVVGSLLTISASWAFLVESLAK